MASLREYCSMMSTEQLQAVLREECRGHGSLPVEAILGICGILAERDPNMPDVRETLLKLCRIYWEG